MRQLSTDFRRSPVYTKSRKYRHPHLPQLFYMVKSRNWNSALRRTQTHPNEISCVEEISGDSPLHFACRLNPPENIVRALISSIYEKNNEGATALHVACSHRCSEDVIKVLVKERPIVENCHAVATFDEPESDVDPLLLLSLTKIGRSPLHYACLSFRGLGIAAFKILLEATIAACVRLEKGTLDDANDWEAMNEFEWEDVTDWQASAFTMQDHLGHTPLSLLFRRYRERVRCVINMLERNRNASMRLGHSMNSSVAADAVQDELGELWLKSRLMVSLMAEKRLEREGSPPCIDFLEESCSVTATAALEAAKWARQQYQLSEHEKDSNDYSNGRKFRLVHASVGLTGYGCPPEMIRLAISVYPNQVREMDEDGNLPLHIACVASSFLPHPDHTSSWTFSDEASWQSGLSNLSFMSNDPNPFEKVIRTLLRIYPQGARIPNCRGRLPLIAAIEGRKRTMNDGIKTLLDIYPAALESKEIDLKLYPLILSILGKPKGDQSDKLVPNALFDILRSKPMLLSNLG